MWLIKCFLISWWTRGQTRQPKSNLEWGWIMCRSTGWSEPHRKRPLVHHSHSWWQPCRTGLCYSNFTDERVTLEEAGLLVKASQPGQGQDGSPAVSQLVHTFDLRTGGHQSFIAWESKATLLNFNHCYQEDLSPLNFDFMK